MTFVCKECGKLWNSLLFPKENIIKGKKCTVCVLENMLSQIIEREDE